MLYFVMLQMLRESRLSDYDDLCPLFEDGRIRSLLSGEECSGSAGGGPSSGPMGHRRRLISVKTRPRNP